MSLVASFKFEDIPITLGKHTIAWVTGRAWLLEDGTIEEIDFDAFRDGRWDEVTHQVGWGKNRLDTFDERLVLVIANEIGQRCKAQIADALSSNSGLRVRDPGPSQEARL